MEHAHDVADLEQLRVDLLDLRARLRGEGLLLCGGVALLGVGVGAVRSARDGGRARELCGRCGDDEEGGCGA